MRQLMGQNEFQLSDGANQLVGLNGLSSSEIVRAVKRTKCAGLGEVVQQE